MNKSIKKKKQSNFLSQIVSLQDQNLINVKTCNIVLTLFILILTVIVWDYTCVEVISIEGTIILLDCKSH